MLSRWTRPQSRTVTLLLGAMAGLLVICIVLYPENAFQSSLRGLTLWWKLVFPALLPFLILTEIARGFGLLEGFGQLLNPLMRLLFRVPGAGGWALAVGLTAGYPAGADVTARLRADLSLTRSEGERLLAISHLANPMLMVGIVGAGFLQSPEAGFAIAVIHYAAAAIVGVMLRFYGSRERMRTDEPYRFIGSQVLVSMRKARRKDGRTFGKLLGDAVGDALQTLLLIGGYMMIFSVAGRIIELIVPVVSAHGWFRAAVPAVLEPHLGSFAATLGPHAHIEETGIITGGWSSKLVWQAALAGAVLGWSGLSSHAQVMGLTRTTDLRYVPFLASRFLHAVLAFALTITAWAPLMRLLGGVESRAAFVGMRAAASSGGTSANGLLPAWSWGYEWRLLAVFMVLIGGMLAISAVLRFLAGPKADLRR